MQPCGVRALTATCIFAFLTACSGGGGNTNAGLPPNVTVPGATIKSLAAAPSHGLVLSPTTLTFASPTSPAQSFTSTTQYQTSLQAASSNTAICTVDPATVETSNDSVTGQKEKEKSATFTVTPVSAGACSISVTDKKGNVGTVAVTVYDATTIALTAAPNPGTGGQQVTFTAKVTDQAEHPVAGGSVTFNEGTSALCAPATTDATGTATCATSTLTVGRHIVTASLTAFSFYTAIVSSSITEVVQSPVTIACFPYLSGGSPLIPSGSTFPVGTYLQCNLAVPNGDAFTFTYTSTNGYIVVIGPTSGVSGSFIAIAAFSPNTGAFTLTDTTTSVSSAPYAINWV